MSKTSTFSRSKRLKVFQLLDGLCWYCGTKIELENFNIDHIFPRCRGGNHSFENLVPSCRKCNASKGKIKDLEIFRFRMASKESEIPHFSELQIEWFFKNNIKLPIKKFEFAFETSEKAKKICLIIKNNFNAKTLEQTKNIIKSLLDIDFIRENLDEILKKLEKFNTKKN